MLGTFLKGDVSMPEEPDEKTVEHEESAYEWLKRHKLLCFACVAAGIAIAGLGAWIMKSAMPKPLPAASTDTAPDVGIVDLSQAFQALDAYAEFMQLQQDRDELLSELASYDGQLTVMAPQLVPDAFQQVADKKAQHLDIKSHNEYLDFRKKKADEWQDAHGAQFDARSKELDDAYLNRIINLRLKIDNRESMRLTDSDVSKLEAELKEVQSERGMKQRELHEEYRSELMAYMSSLDQQHSAEMRRIQQQHAEQANAEMAAKMQEAQQRDAEAMAAAAADQTSSQLEALEKALEAKDEEIATMEEQMLDDIAGRASKLAIIHHLTMIYASFGADIHTISPDGNMFDLGPMEQVPIFGTEKGTIDLTEELLSEMSD